MIRTWLWSSWTQIGLVVVSSVAMLVAVLIVIRLIGLRSLSKMTSTDFAVTVAIGSIVGGVAASSSSLVNGAVAVATLLLVQALIAQLRRWVGPGSFIDNEPVLLMVDGEFRRDALAATRVTEHDVLAKLREANVTHMDDVLAVVLETTGDVSVLHGDGPLDDRLLEGVHLSMSA